MYDKPRFAFMIAYATLPNLAWLALVNLIGVDFLAYLCAFFVGFGSWYVVIVQIESELADHKRVNGRDDVKPSVAPQPEPRVILNMNKADGYALTTQAVSIDVMTIKMKRFSRTLINQRENRFKVDLREKAWEGQFGGRKNYVHVRDVRMAGAFAKENPELDNSRFVVAGEAGWRVVEAAANGRM